MRFDRPDMGPDPLEAALKGPRRKIPRIPRHGDPEEFQPTSLPTGTTSVVPVTHFSFHRYARYSFILFRAIAGIRNLGSEVVYIDGVTGMPGHVASFRFPDGTFSGHVENDSYDAFIPEDFGGEWKHT